MLLRITFSLMMCLGALFAAQAQDVGDVPMGEIGDPNEVLIMLTRPARGAMR